MRASCGVRLRELGDRRTHRGQRYRRRAFGPLTSDQVDDPLIQGLLVSKMIKCSRSSDGVAWNQIQSESSRIMTMDSSHKDIRQLRRYITTHAEDGRTTFITDVSEEPQFKQLPNKAEFALCYASNRIPTQLADDADVTTYKNYTENLPGITISTGTVLRVVDMPPGALSPMHRTISLDYGVVLEGRVELVLDSGETRVLERGDISVQRGTNHAWRNMSKTSWARMLYVLVPAENLVVAGERLADNTLETIPGHK